jgi:tetratricopeptide (TPR) repeat protein/predicted Ser/Thr protein kinase
MVGRTLAHYILIEKLGAGGMGVVYRARDTQLEREVALKIVGEKDRIDEQAQARLMREARTASALNHANICTIYGAGVAEGVTYIAMELVEGQSLDSIVAAGPLPVDLVVRYAIAIAEALAHAHERGVVHRDLKCANVMITPDGHLKVLDFGLAKRVTVEVHDATRTVTQAGMLMGTPLYMAPEILQGQPAGPPADLWALGVILYRALAGAFPFAGFAREEPAPLPAHVPRRLVAVVRRLLAGKAAERFPSAAALRDALHPPVPRPRARWPWIAALLVLFLAFAAMWSRLRTPAPTYRASPNRQANEYYERAIQLFGPASARAEPDQMARMLERALEADPKFAAARALHAWSLIMLLWGGFSNDAGLLYTAEAGARRALLDDPGCGQAFADLAVVHLLQGRKELFPGEMERAKKAGMPVAQAWGIVYHHLNGDYEVAIAQAREVIARAPLQWPPHLYLGDLLREQGDTAGAIGEQSKILEQEADNGAAIGALAQVYLDKGELAHARQTLDRAGNRQRKGYRIRIVWALLLAAESRRDEALREMDAGLQTYSGAHVFMPLKAAEFYAVMGDHSRALDWLDRAVRMGDDREAWLRRDPHLAAVRGDPRFEQMLASVSYRRRHRTP